MPTYVDLQMDGNTIKILDFASTKEKAIKKADKSMNLSVFETTTERRKIIKWLEVNGVPDDELELGAEVIAELGRKEMTRKKKSFLRIFGGG